MKSKAMLPSRVISITVDRPWREVYDTIWRPQDFTKWASGLRAADLTQDGDIWKGHSPEGVIAVRFTPHNAFGILDHTVDVGHGRLVHVPIRVLQNADGADIQVTLFRQPEMSDARFEADAQWIERDLQALAKLVAP